MRQYNVYNTDRLMSATRRRLMIEVARRNDVQYIDGYCCRMEDGKYPSVVGLQLDNNIRLIDVDSNTGYFRYTYLRKSRINQIWIDCANINDRPNVKYIESINFNVDFENVTDLSAFFRLNASTSKPYIQSNLTKIMFNTKPTNSSPASATSFMSYLSNIVSEGDSWIDLSGLKLNISARTFYTYTNARISTIKKLGFPSICGGDSNTNCYVFYGLTDIPVCGNIYSSLNLLQAPLSLESAKVVINALQDLGSDSATLTLSDKTWSYIDNEESQDAMDMIYEKSELGWNFV